MNAPADMFTTRLKEIMKTALNLEQLLPTCLMTGSVLRDDVLAAVPGRCQGRQRLRYVNVVLFKGLYRGEHHD